MTQTQEWLDQVQENILFPEQRIVDPHHHLWRNEENPYLLNELWADTGSGHKVEKTVFVECTSDYFETGLRRPGGPLNLYHK